jgi:3-oxoacyl-ACP reductase-like protein
MSVFGNIMSAIFGKSTSPAPAPTAPTGEAAQPAAPGKPASFASTQAAPAAPAAAPASGPAAAEAPAPAAMAAVDVEAIMDKLSKDKKAKLDWRKSIVDLMKLLDLDSSLAARKELAKELKYTGDMGDSAKMNVWLHKQVMIKLAENGGKVPESLKS